MAPRGLRHVLLHRPTAHLRRGHAPRHQRDDVPHLLRLPHRSRVADVRQELHPRGDRGQPGQDGLRQARPRAVPQLPQGPVRRTRLPRRPRRQGAEPPARHPLRRPVARLLDGQDQVRHRHRQGSTADHRVHRDRRLRPVDHHRRPLRHHRRPQPRALAGPPARRSGAGRLLGAELLHRRAAADLRVDQVAALAAAGLHVLHRQPAASGPRASSCRRSPSPWSSARATSG